MMQVDIETARAAVHRAIAKLDQIIAREGDMDGARREPDYLQVLIQEQIHEAECQRIYGGVTL